MSIFYQNAIKNFISSKLDENSQGILFNTQLYNNIDEDDFNATYVITNTYGTEKKRKVPTMITGINGEYIPIPNLSGTTNSVEILFDLAVDDMTGLAEEDEFVSAKYDETLLAIDEFRKALLANYYPLGTPSLFLGGDDSNVVGTSGTSFAVKFIYIKFTPKNTDVEKILKGTSATEAILRKDATHIIFDIDASELIKVPYTINENIEITISKNASNVWSITNGTETETEHNLTAPDFLTIKIGDGTGIECILDRLVLDSSYSALIDNTVTYGVDLVNWDNKDVVVNSGSTAHTFTINNCILHGADGNAVFTVYPLSVVDKYEAQSGINYHTFSLQLEAFVGEDFIFGNNFEYSIDGIRVYPVDRNHTFGLDTNGRQAINTNQMKFIGSDSALDWTQSFFYTPTKQITNLIKKITTGDVDQNTTYVLKVQYPFWNKEYDVIIENGGINTDLNSITTFTLTFKPADSILV